MAKTTNPLIINVGFIVTEDNGYARNFEFDFPELELAHDLHLLKVSGNAQFTRTPQGLLADVQFAGIVNGECSRCLDATEIQLATRFNELFAFDERSTTESELLVPDDRMIDLEPLVREYLLLDMPITSLCKSDCLGLCGTCGKNLNRDKHVHEEDDIDPRLAALKDLLEDKDK
ncbi:MAG: DUF177 domain-containing protein [Chloroflexota bacterium]